LHLSYVLEVLFRPAGEKEPPKEATYHTAVVNQENAMTYQDYILRHIQQAGRAWARIVRMIKDRQFETAQMVLDQAYRQLIGLAPESALERDPNDLIARLRFDEPPAAGRDKCLALVTLLRASGAIAAAQGDSAAAAEAYHKALQVLLDTALRDPSLALPEHVPTVESLDAELAAHTLPVTTQQELLLYYEQAGVYAKAEDFLWAMLQAAPGDCAIINVGRALYTRLQQLSDATLIAGNLPREEVAGGLADLDAYAGEHGC
jgi:tetratricopeptide (TPR) repeat protein